MIKNTILLEIRKAVLLVMVFTVLLGVIYPLVVWGGAQIFFPNQANGSLIRNRDGVIGSVLIGQGFTGPEFFHPRPSAAGKGYDATASGGSNLGPLSPSLFKEVERRVKVYREENGLPEGIKVPVDAVTASASGLDPDITIENARLQASRIARARGISLQLVLSLIEKNTENRQLGILGERRVNVLLLNDALKKIK